jgi:hypothetical protein
MGEGKGEGEYHVETERIHLPKHQPDAARWDSTPYRSFQDPGSVRELGVSSLSSHLGGVNRFKTLIGFG